jgi:hypothetical protein
MFALVLALIPQSLIAEDVQDCRTKENRAAFEAKAKEVASEHCSGKYKKLSISDSALKLESSPVATHLISYECGKPAKKYHGVLQLMPDDNCTAIGHQRILAVQVK